MQFWKFWKSSDTSTETGALPSEVVLGADPELDASTGSDMKDIDIHPIRVNVGGEAIVTGSFGNLAQERWRGADAGGDFTTAYSSLHSIAISDFNTRLFDKKQIIQVLRITAAGVMTRLSLTNLVLTENLVQDGSSPANIFGITNYVLTNADWTLANTDKYVVTIATTKKHRNYIGVRMFKTSSMYWDGTNVIHGAGAVTTFDPIDTRHFNRLTAWLDIGDVSSTDTDTNSVRIGIVPLYSSSHSPIGRNAVMMVNDDGTEQEYFDKSLLWNDPVFSPAAGKKLTFTMKLHAPWYPLNITSNAAKGSGQDRTLRAEYLLFNE